jgi:hypothetical protein
MSKRIDKSWLVFASIESGERDRCVDVFLRPDKTFGFEEFRRDVEDLGEWTPVQYCSELEFETAAAAYDAAQRSVPWLAEILSGFPQLRKMPI